MSQDVLGLVHYPLCTLLTILRVLEADIVQGKLSNCHHIFFERSHHIPLTISKYIYIFNLSGHTPLLQDDEETILFHRVEGMQTIQDLQEVLHKSEMVITITDHIPQDMRMLVAMVMASKWKSIYLFQHF